MGGMEVSIARIDDDEVRARCGQQRPRLALSVTSDLSRVSVIIPQRETNEGVWIDV